MQECEHVRPALPWQQHPIRRQDSERVSGQACGWRARREGKREFGAGGAAKTRKDETAEESADGNWTGKLGAAKVRVGQSG